MTTTSVYVGPLCGAVPDGAFQDPYPGVNLPACNLRKGHKGRHKTIAVIAWLDSDDDLTYYAAKQDNLEEK